MEAVFSRRQDLARMILDWFPFVVRWNYRGLKLGYGFITVAVAKSWYVTCKGQTEMKRESTVAVSMLENKHSACIYFEKDPMDLGVHLRYEDCCTSILRLVYTNEFEFCQSMRDLMTLSCANWICVKCVDTIVKSDHDRPSTLNFVCEKRVNFVCARCHVLESIPSIDVSILWELREYWFCNSCQVKHDQYLFEHGYCMVP